MGDYDTEKLLSDYEPLIKSVSKKFNKYFVNYEDKKDLFHQVQYEFVKLVGEYDTRRGVDFPMYIKKMLPLRVYHFVTKRLSVVNKESVYDEVFSVVPEIPDSTTEYELVEGLASLDMSKVSGSKRKRLLDSILIQRKTLEEIAEEEGVDIKVIRLRFHFLCKKLREEAIKKKHDLEGNEF